MVTSLFSVINLISCFAFFWKNQLGTFNNRGIFYKAGILMKQVIQAILKIQIHLRGLATLCSIIFHTFLAS